MKTILDHTHDEAKNIKTFWFKPEKPARYTAGQFTEIRLKHDKPDDRGDKRWFTVSSSPTDAMMSITTKWAGDKASSFKKTLFSLPMGTEVQLAEPMGDFVLPKQTDRPLVFVAGGIGVTPMHSMIKWLVDTGEKRDIHLLYAANKLEDVAFRDLFEKAPITFQIILNNPPKDWKGKSGMLTADAVLEVPGVADTAMVYLSGPEPMIEKLFDDLKAKGVDKKRLITDYFPNYDAI
ncbi:MAG TPA: FAD-dependent oxidoreductase [Verrucomicrobiae bacterium]|nr:FAD-dependent oxidoreductase [Verrucomicrobiae bacterium]